MNIPIRRRRLLLHRVQGSPVNAIINEETTFDGPVNGWLGAINNQTKHEPSFDGPVNNQTNDVLTYDVNQRAQLVVVAPAPSLRLRGTVKSAESMKARQENFGPWTCFGQGPTKKCLHVSPHLYLSEAVKYCLDHKSILVTILNAQENQYVKDICPSRCFIGLGTTQDTKAFFWLAQQHEPVTYFNMASNTADLYYHGYLINENGKWANCGMNCGRSFAVCEQRPQKDLDALTESLSGQWWAPTVINDCPHGHESAFYNSPVFWGNELWEILCCL